jgi:hypothetical protein
MGHGTTSERDAPRLRAPHDPFLLGQEPVNTEELAKLIVAFSQMAFDLRDEVESIDLNPVLCSREEAIIADPRFMLKN